MAYKALKYEFVEIQVPGVAGGQTNTQWNFPDLPKLRYTSLQAMTTYTAGTITASPTNVPPPATSILAKSYLVLYANERQDLYRIPLLELNRIQNSATDPFVRSLFEFGGVKVTWEKSYVQIASAPANTTNISFQFGVYYV
jgi:hypothetical protein